MRCQDCDGSGTLPVLALDPPRIERGLPCPSCGGTGQQSCCEGAVGNARDVTNQGGRSMGDDATFLDVPRRCDAATSIAGVPYDLGVTGRTGAALGPAAIRWASRMLVDGAHPLNGVEVADLDIGDVGDLEVANTIPDSLEMIEAQALRYRHLVTLGGDHSITLPILRALRRRVGEPLALVHFDAHVDTWPHIGGEMYGHASPIRHAIEENLVNKVVQIGIRSPTPRPVMEWTRARTTMITAADVRLRECGATAARIMAICGLQPSYLTIDIDALDPAFAPGTGTPEIGGLTTSQIRDIMPRLRGLDFRGMDVVEVSPPYDHAEITALAAATLVWDYLALLAPPRV